ncbi:hypothetical protein MP228_008030 [Amoeboaphelidium protococcarum]|nr:hypothetical protein MP228_008030 [Amoeboaphelidium protococcarum]
MFLKQCRQLATKVSSQEGTQVAASSKSVAPNALTVGDPLFKGKFIKQGGGGRMSNSGHTVTVFGCTGFLGRYLVQQLAKRGSQVVVAYRGSPEDVRHLKVTGDLGQVVPLRFDSRDDDSLVECMRHSDTVFNLVGRDYETRNFTFDGVHVDAARNIARVAREVGVARFVHVSALNSDPLSPSQFYASKGRGEEAVLKEHEGAVIVRPGQMFGWEDRLTQYLGTTVTHPVKRWATGGYIPMVHGGERQFNPVYVGDVAHAIYNVLNVEQPHKVYEFHGPDRYVYREFVRLFCEYARRPYFPLNVPHKLYRSIMGQIAAVNPLNRYNQHDVDRATISDTIHDASTVIGGQKYSVGKFQDVGLRPQNTEALLIRFVRHFRSDEFVDSPATFGETHYWRQLQQRK